MLNHKKPCTPGPINLNQPDYSQQREKELLFNRNWNMILQNETVEMLLKDEKISYDDIENMYRTDKEIQEDDGPGLTEDELEEIRDDEYPKEVFQWFLIQDDHLFEFLRDNDEVVAETDYGNYWGRTEFGIAIYMTSIFDKYYSKFGRRNK